MKTKLVAISISLVLLSSPARAYDMNALVDEWLEEAQPKSTLVIEAEAWVDEVLEEAGNMMRGEDHEYL